MPKQVYLVALDGSEWGERAAMRAVNLAQQTDAKVVLLTVIPWSGFTPMTLEEIAQRPLEKKEEEAAARDKILKPVADKYADTGVEIETVFNWGHPVEQIHAYAKANKIQMIFVGRRGRSRIADLVLGSVANSLAHTVGVPIVLVP